MRPAEPERLASFQWKRAYPGTQWIEIGSSSDRLAPRWWLVDWPEVDETGTLPYARSLGDEPLDDVLTRVEQLEAAARYSPFELGEDPIFMNFAELAVQRGDVTFEKRCETFALAYGLLGIREELPRILPGPEAGHYCRSGESLQTWRQATSLLLFARRLFEADCSSDALTRKASKTWVVEALKRRERSIKRGRFFIATQIGGPREGFELPLNPKGVIDQDYRRYLLTELTNFFLQDGIAHAIVEDERGRNTLQVIPRDLWRFMWYQLAEAQGAIPRFLQCKTCGRWWTRQDKVRGHRRYCDQTCKQLAYERRKARAVELHQGDQTRTADAIAKVLNEEAGYPATSAASVAKWLAEAVQHTD